MPNSIQMKVQSRIHGWLQQRPPAGLAGAAFWLAVWFLLTWLLHLLPGAVGIFFRVLQVLIGIALVCVAIPILLRLIRDRMLWSLRNKLILTYLLIGLAPVVLFVTLVGISGYIAAGQFAIHLADTRVQAELDQMSTENAGRAARIAHFIATQPAGAQTPAEIESRSKEITYSEHITVTATQRAHLYRRMEAFINGVPVVLPKDAPRPRVPFGLPAWAVQLERGNFHSVVLDGGEVSLVTLQQERMADGRLFTLLSSLPIDSALMDLVADGLGRAQIFAQKTSGTPSTADAAVSSTSSGGPGDPIEDRRNPRFTAIAGGTEPPPSSLADIRVRFLSTITVTDWETGKTDSVPIVVDSRPTLLYRQLFGASLSGIVTSALRIGLIGLCILFALIEIVALVMAMRLSRTMTASVADLYKATLHIDRGDLQHRIAVSRTDQLAELSRSFNRMTVSLQRLLGEQQEKERLQSELSIAQEVQANLFPTGVRDLPTLELHGICRPARSVSGDYYDFLVFYKDAQNEELNGHSDANGHPEPNGHLSARAGTPSRVETGVGIALGDISGKGISAALLMANLHSAVRAYRFASEEVVYTASSVAGLTASRDGRTGDTGELFASPGRIMALLNRHLYRSTTPEKYATLFLAHYDASSSWLTYSTAGQLPPLLLSRDGAIRRLDCGGTVVGLMDGMMYEEGHFQMHSGDILVAYSDGVTEPENDFGDFGEERLMEVVGRYRDQPLHVISSQVMQALDAWIGADEQPDDITLVLARQA